ncbi:MAG: HIT family protein [Anaerolineales bacterium]
MSFQADCIFCQILQGEREASFVYRDETVTAFMDLFPVVPGHVLVIPNDHQQDFSRVEPEQAGQMFQLGREIGSALHRSGMSVEGISYFLAEGEAAGQVVPHAHLHIIPRHAGDDCGLQLHKGIPERAERGVLDRRAAALREALKPDAIF